MTTRIKGLESSGVDGGARPVGRVQRPARNGTADKSSDGAGSAVQSVHITDTAHQLVALQRTINELPDVDQSRVEQVRAEIEQNRYRIDAGRIADRLLQMEGDLQATDRSVVA